ncbi:MAG: ABC transporter permease [Actinomycetia bacterium]|nr:ABC transporter permease [Actinomycetes bacterium]
MRQELKQTYGRYKLGLLWTMGEPFVQALFMWIVFAFIFGSTKGITLEPFIVYLVTGLVPLAWLSASVAKSTKAFRRYSKDAATSALPVVAWPLRVVLYGFADFLLALPVVVIFVISFYLFTGEPSVHWQLVYFPLGIFMQFFLCLGLAMILSAMALRLPDVERLTALLNRFFFWMSPVIWQTRNFPDVIPTWVLYLNPFHGILDFYRAAFWPDDVLKGPGVYILTAAVIAVICVVGAMMLHARAGLIRRADV